MRTHFDISVSQIFFQFDYFLGGHTLMFFFRPTFEVVPNIVLSNCFTNISCSDQNAIRITLQNYWPTGIFCRVI